MNLVVGHSHRIFRTGCLTNQTERLIAYALIHEIAACIRTVAKLIDSRFPRQTVEMGSRFLDCKAVDRERLDNVVVLAVKCIQELNHTLVDGTADRKAECRVKTVAHIGQVLVREQLEQHGRHFRHACLIVGSIPHAAACPMAVVLRTHVVHNIGKHHIGQHA